MRSLTEATKTPYRCCAVTTRKTGRLYKCEVCGRRYNRGGVRVTANGIPLTGSLHYGMNKPVKKVTA